MSNKRKKLNRQDRYFVLTNLIERLRSYKTFEALNDLGKAMGEIEKKHDLIPKLTKKEQRAVAMYEKKIERGEHVRELDQNFEGMSLEDFLPETPEALAKRLSTLSENDRDAISGIITQLIEIDAPPYRMSPALIASLNHQIREIDAGRERTYTVKEAKLYLRKKRAERS